RSQTHDGDAESPGSTHSLGGSLGIHVKSSLTLRGFFVLELILGHLLDTTGHEPARQQGGSGHGQTGNQQVVGVAQTCQTRYCHHVRGEWAQHQTGGTGTLEQGSHSGRRQTHGGGNWNHHRSNNGVTTSQRTQSATDQGGRHHDAQTHAHRIGQANTLHNGSHQLLGSTCTGGHFTHPGAQHNNQAHHGNKRAQGLGQQFA